jgi:hypothetical protein
MIHHISISVKNPRHVANVLAELLQGSVIPFPPLDGAYVVIAKDAYGTMLEVYPLGSEIMPGQSQDEASFCRNAHPYHFTSVHAAISVPVSQATIEAIAKREGWRVLPCDRDGLFDLVEFWVENRLMLELLPPVMAVDYLQAMSPANLNALAQQFAGVAGRH